MTVTTGGGDGGGTMKFTTKRNYKTLSIARFTLSEYWLFGCTTGNRCLLFARKQITLGAVETTGSGIVMVL